MDFIKYFLKWIKRYGFKYSLQQHRFIIKSYIGLVEMVKVYNRHDEFKIFLNSKINNRWLTIPYMGKYIEGFQRKRGMSYHHFLDILFKEK